MGIDGEETIVCASRHSRRSDLLADRRLQLTNNCLVSRVDGLRSPPLCCTRPLDCPVLRVNGLRYNRPQQHSRPSTSVHSQLSEQPSVVDGTTRPAPRATNDRVHCTSQSTVPASEPAVDCTRQSTPHTNDRSQLHESVDQHHNQRQESTARVSRLNTASERGANCTRQSTHPRQQSTVARKHSRPSQSREQSTAAHPQQPTDDTITQSTVRESLTVPSTQSTLTTAARH